MEKTEKTQVRNQMSENNSTVVTIFINDENDNFHQGDENKHIGDLLPVGMARVDSQRM